MKLLLPYFAYLKPYFWRYLGGIGAGVVYGITSGFGMAFITAKVLPLVFTEDPPNGMMLFGILVLLPAIALLRAASGYFNAYCMGYCQKHMMVQMRTEMMAHIQGLSLAFYHNNRTGRILARVLNDTIRISSVVTSTASDLIKQPVTILGAIGVIIYLSIQQREVGILAIAFVLLPLCIFIIREVGRRITSKEQKEGDADESLHAIVHESIASARETRAFNLQEKEITTFRRKAANQLKVALRLLSYRSVISPSIEVVSSVAVAGAVYYASTRKLDIETIIPLLMAMYMCYQPFKKVGTIYATLQRALMAAKRIEKIYGSEDRLELTANPKVFEGLHECIEFKEVTFRYSKKRVFRKLSIKISKGERIALIGPSGSGKSTFCNLLCRFYDPEKGDVCFDGVSLRELEESDIRQHIALVPQDSFLFADSIMNNIRVGLLDASDESVIEAAKLANAHEFIVNMPEGYETRVAERGASLSGGQRQRIALARAFLRDADILIFDEATSALDSESEGRVQDAMIRLMEGKTVIFIAHRYSTIRLANRVLVFDEGCIISDGDSETLEKESQFYRKLKYVDGSSSSIEGTKEVGT